MSDLRRVFEGLDRLDTPASWPEVKRRTPGPPTGEPGRSRRVLVVGLALAIAAAGASFAVRALVFAPTPNPLGGPSTGPHRPTPSPTGGRCVHARTTGDFDGDGTLGNPGLRKPDLRENRPEVA